MNVVPAEIPQRGLTYFNNRFTRGVSAKYVKSLNLLVSLKCLSFLAQSSVIDIHTPKTTTFSIFEDVLIA